MKNQLWLARSRALAMASSGSNKTPLRRLLRHLCAAQVMCVASSTALAAGMTTAHQFAVTESGAATISIPLQVPRGIGGMEPQLSLNYTSAGGNGLLGQGWALGGPSAITRCPKNMVTDGERGTVKFAVGDRYCLDGQRLEIVNQANTDALYGTANSEYRTERDTFSRIRASATTYGGQATVPNSFTVETKAGLKLEFGISGNSQVTTNYLVTTTTATIRAWNLQRISDRHGNSVEFVYCKGEVNPVDGLTCGSVWYGSTVLHFIRYTNRNGLIDGTMGVLFKYETRPDMVRSYYLGSVTRQTQRLKSVEMYHGFSVSTTAPYAVVPGSLVRAYDLTYEALVDSASLARRATNISLVSQIQERAADGSVLPALEFTLAPDAVFGQNVNQGSALGVGPPRPPTSCGGVIGSRLTLQCR